MDFLETLADRILLFDGAFGTMLQQSGVEVPDLPELLNATHPELITEIHRQYIEAGSDIIETNSLGLNAIALRRHGMEDRLEELVTAAVRCARAAAGEERFVALSMGPTGGMLQPLGELTFSEVYTAYRRQAVAGWKAGADIAFIETMGDAAQARIAALAVQENTGLPAAISYTFENNGKMLMGGSPQTGAIIAEAIGCRMVGTNCSGGPDVLYPVICKMKQATNLPLVVQPNAGLPELDTEGRTHFPLSPAETVKKMEPILRSGISAAGGCCGTNPTMIRLLKEKLYGLQKPEKLVLPKTLASERSWAALDVVETENAEWIDATDEDAIYDADPGAECGYIDFKKMEEAQIPEWLDEAQMMLKMPLIFRVTNNEQAEAALRKYTGRAGITGQYDAGTAAKYGAVCL